MTLIANSCRRIQSTAGSTIPLVVGAGLYTKLANTHKNNTIQTEQVAFMYLEIYVYTYMNVAIINEKGYRFEGEQ